MIPGLKTSRTRIAFAVLGIAAVSLGVWWASQRSSASAVVNGEAPAIANDIDREKYNDSATATSTPPHTNTATTNAAEQPDSQELAAMLSPHHIPAEKVPPAAAARWTPPTPAEPADPALTPMEMNNPGGVDGTRPPRAAAAAELATSPGLDSTEGPWRAMTTATPPNPGALQSAQPGASGDSSALSPSAVPHNDRR